MKEEGRRNKEEGRRKKEEGRGKKEEGRRKKEEGIISFYSLPGSGLVMQIWRLCLYFFKGSTASISQFPGWSLGTS
ncbi:hypothetical protein IQ269_20260 [Tychonema sp. LEGE 07199]|uniref:hypothetical protein n=1 Tax=unclassified Tychonema TaxID=2642144 RepID=UPI00187E978A|nr:MULTISPECIES: hypothetical protein [unclassified Tychonema]MBE9123067.1 hypothetical protein [Tychonema sp. LEGE 07199]MBE9132797.1 hypothetical protein [Tychonema sp. LEGE 07196]